MKTLLYLLLSIFVIFTALVQAESHHQPHPPRFSMTQVPEDIRVLIKQEMHQILAGIQQLTAAIATGDWAKTHQTAMDIHHSYIMKKQLTPAQMKSLHHVLPEKMRHYDQEFHGNAKKLALAAADKNRELITFYHYRLLDTCTRCHSSFAAETLTGYQSLKQPKQHQH